MNHTRFPEREYFISKADLFEQVSINVIQGISAELPGLKPWESARLRKRPIKIYDINGELLFLDYRVVRRSEVVGYVRAAASKILGQSVVSLIHGSNLLDSDQAIEKLLPKLRKKYPARRVIDAKLVCYSYPKLGIMFQMVDRRGKLSRLICDGTNLRPIHEIRPGEDVEGDVAWSFYDSLEDDERADRLERYEDLDKIRMRVPESTRRYFIEDRNLIGIYETVHTVLPAWTTVTKQLQFCDHYEHDEARSHHCFVLHGQQTNDYCAVATCQMILCYYRYYYTQNQIAPSLNYTAGVGCPADQSAGYETLSNNHIDATFDSSPTWGEARNAIDALQPFKSGISGHARACAGYLYVSWYGFEFSRRLYIYDPSPWNLNYKLGGSVYWENFGSVTLTNYVRTRLIY